MVNKIIKTKDIKQVFFQTSGPRSGVSWQKNLKINHL